MSNFPNNFDDDTTLPFVNDDITEVGGDAINALRDATFATQQYLGLGGAGTAGSISARLGVSLAPDGTIKPSAITSLGLVTLPITENQIANNANIPESKLRLDHRTQDLYNYIKDLSHDVNLAIGWVSTSGIKLEPHLMGAIYRHSMDQIDVSALATNFLKNNQRTLRDNTNSYTLVDDMNDELLAHQWADGSPFGTPHTIVTNNGSVYSSYYGHTASGIFINTSRFNNIPETADDVQLFAEYIDSSSIFLLGTRIQNLYTNGISRVSRSSNLTEDGYGQFIIPPTPAIAFLKNVGNISNPVDDIDNGDDIIEFKPSTAEMNNNTFDAKFALVKPGDIVRVNYGTIEVPFVIKEKKYAGTPGAKKYIVRIAGKNHFYAPLAVARVDKPLFNANKFGELAISPVNNQFDGPPSLIVNNPRGAQATGVGFNPDQLDENHYLLYLALYPTGHASDGYTILPGIDVTGNQGTTPGLYTLQSVVQATNNAFRAVGFNYRFTAFAYQGEFGICLADSYNNAAFSIVSVALKADGTIDTLATQLNLPKNVVDLQPTVGTIGPDPLGFGPTGSGSASPPYYSTYGSAAASQYPTKLFVPLRRNSYYVNGSEKERLDREPTQTLDGYGDGYWVATINDIQVPAGRVQITYRIPLDLSTSQLKAGKTIVVQSLGSGGLVDFGRYIIQSVVFGCSPTTFTDITVYDAVHAQGNSPAPTLQPFSEVAIYFGYDSVSFNTESATDYSVYLPFKRHFEVYVDQDGRTFTHERGRIPAGGSDQTVNGVLLYGYSQLNKLNIVKISPKLRGFQFGGVNKITLRMFSYNATTGVYDGYLASYDGTNFTHFGPRTTGKKGEVTRFYDETNTDFIDVVYDINDSVSGFTDQLIDFQLFPTLSLDDELMLLGTCQVDDSTNDSNKIVSQVLDGRQFGNTSEKDLSTSVFDFMSIPEKHLHSNGVVRGFEIYQTFDGPSALLYLTGGIALVNGKMLNLNNDTVTIPAIRESFSTAFWPVNWVVCVNDSGDYKIIPLLDQDGSITTPSDINRLFTAADFVGSTTYTLPAVKFVDLVNTRKDLTPLYIVSATVTGTPTAPNVAITARDARRFVYKKDWGERPTFTSGTENGEFRTLGAVTSWLNLNYSFNNSVNVRGVFTNLPASFSFNTLSRFFGDGQAVFTLTQPTTISNLEINDIDVVANTTVTFDDSTLNRVNYSGTTNFGANNATVYEGSFTALSGSQLTFSNSVLDNVNIQLQGGSSLSFTNCKVSNCTITLSGGSNTVNILGVNDIQYGNTYNFSSASNTMNITGSLTNNKFNWTAITNSVNLSGNFSVLGNYFNSTALTPITQFLSIADTSNGTISGNFFFRNSNVLTAYIIAPASYSNGMVAIVDNFFDSPTVDGSNQNLVANLPIVWYYSRNLNAPPSVQVKRITSGGAYIVLVTDHVLAMEHTSPATINLPAVNMSPVGRVIVIKDVLGRADVFPITIHRANTTETIENLTSDYVYNNPYGCLTLVRSNNGWIIV